MKQGNYILWLPSWYPNKLQPFNGDFIQRHARAVAAFHEIEVINVVRDEFGNVTKDVLIERSSIHNVSETTVYYYVKPNPISAIDKLNSIIKYQKVFGSVFKQLVAKKGLPKFAHVHIAMKAGLLALWLKRKYKIPYVASDQWVIYLPEAKPGFQQQSLIFRFLFKKVFTNAAGISVVSKTLGSAIVRLFNVPQPIVIPNVVDETLFTPVLKTNREQLQLLHVSTLDYQKDPESMIRACSIFKNKYDGNFRLDIVGPRIAALINLVADLDLEQQVLFHTEMPHQQLVNYMQQADCLLLCSRYETFGCVLIEANACGVPVIVTDIPVFHENVRANENGLFVRPADAEHLAEVLHDFAQKVADFDPELIRKSTIEKFSFQKVGQQFSEWYRRSLPGKYK